MKRWLIALAVLLALAGGSFFGIKQYKSWRQTRLVQKAKACLASADYRNASLCARQAVESDPSSIEACRIMADIAEMARSTNALFWRRRVAELQPGNPQNQLVLARTALALGQQAAALEALNATDTGTRQTEDYHKLRGNLSWASGRLGEAEFHFGEAVRLEPGNAVSRMNLNLVRLTSTNAGISANWRITHPSRSTGTRISTK